jgi:hypothetical protein
MAGVKREDLLGGGVSRRADGDRHRRGRTPQASGDVDRLAGEETLAALGVDVEAHQGLAFTELLSLRASHVQSSTR